MKPKINRKGSLVGAKSMDQCQTPAYAIKPLLPYLKQYDVIWEPAAGEGYLIRALFDYGYQAVIASDVEKNFFGWEPAYYTKHITNPPYSIKYPWLERCYELGRPFALLLPVETLGAARAQKLFDKYGIEVIFLSSRINFKMPNKGWNGSSAQFPTAWFTWKFGVGKPISFAKLDIPKKDKKK